MEKELEFLLYSTPQENVKIDVAIKDETIWLTQKAMAIDSSSICSLSEAEMSLPQQPLQSIHAFNTIIINRRAIV